MQIKINQYCKKSKKENDQEQEVYVEQNNEQEVSFLQQLKKNMTEDNYH